MSWRGVQRRVVKPRIDLGWCGLCWVGLKPRSGLFGREVQWTEAEKWGDLVCIGLMGAGAEGCRALTCVGLFRFEAEE